MVGEVVVNGVLTQFGILAGSVETGPFLRIFLHSECLMFYLVSVSRRMSLWFPLANFHITLCNTEAPGWEPAPGP